MKVRPILFSTPMVQANKDGRKTQTRRLMKLQPDNRYYPYVDKIIPDWNGKFYGYSNDSDIDIFFAGKCPYGDRGDVLWVRETWREDYPEFPPAPSAYYYKADFPEGLDVWTGSWRPSIFMPKAAARIFLKITHRWAKS